MADMEKNYDDLIIINLYGCPGMKKVPSLSFIIIIILVFIGSIFPSQKVW